MLVAVAVAAGAYVAGCSGEPPRSPNVLRPIDEPHAVAIMAKVFRDLHLEPVRNRIIKFRPKDAELKLDVAAKERRFGIAYITWQDADKMGEDLPKRNDPDAIIVVRGNGDDDDVHAALLFAADYMQDDLSGEAHTATSIAAEQKLVLATKDILRRAQHESWQWRPAGAAARGRGPHGARGGGRGHGAHPRDRRLLAHGRSADRRGRRRPRGVARPRLGHPPLRPLARGVRA